MLLINALDFSQYPDYDPQFYAKIRLICLELKYVEWLKFLTPDQVVLLRLLDLLVQLIRVLRCKVLLEQFAWYCWMWELVWYFWMWGLGARGGWLILVIRTYFMWVRYLVVHKWDCFKFFKHGINEPLQSNIKQSPLLNFYQQILPIMLIPTILLLQLAHLCHLLSIQL